jgi:TPR repeat protein
MRRADEEFERKNYATAKKLYSREADNGNPAAMYKMGLIYDQGLGEWAASKSKAFRYYRMAAEQEYPEATYKVGEYYENGMGGAAKDSRQALSWYKRSAELGHLPALVKIGLFHENGEGGLERSDDNALVCYLRCADKGNTQAQYLAARIYEKKMLSETIQQKRDEYRRSAKRLYEAAALKEYRDARSRLRSL